MNIAWLFLLCPQISSFIKVFGPCDNYPDTEVPIRVERPNTGNIEELLARINDILDNRWLSNRGPYVREFEDKLSKYLGVKHVISMCSGTVALEIAICALGLRGEVILPLVTYISDPDYAIPVDIKLS